MLQGDNFAPAHAGTQLTQNSFYAIEFGDAGEEAENNFCDKLVLRHSAGYNAEHCLALEISLSPKLAGCVAPREPYRFPWAVALLPDGPFHRGDRCYARR